MPSLPSHHWLRFALFALLIASSVSRAEAQCQTLKWTFNNRAASAGDYFGWSLAISGNSVLVGACNDSTAVTEAGTAYLFDAGTGGLLQTINNPAPATGARFGYSVAIEGNRLIIGYPPGSGSTASTRGKAYIFDATTGALLQTINSPASAAGDYFGLSVAISGNNVVVGAPYGTPIDVFTGIVYLFDVSTGGLLRIIHNPAPDSSGGDVFGDLFGYSVSISGNNVVVGAPYDDMGASSSGIAYLFDAANGALLQTITNPTPATGDYFGFSVAISGNNVLVGTPSIGGTDAGSAYLFHAATGGLLQTVNNPAPATGDYFGWSVAISENNILVGASNDNGGEPEAGSAYLFDAASGGLVHTFNNPTPAMGDRFGHSVAMDGNNLIMGKPFSRTGTSGAQGIAYLFEVTNVGECPTPTPSPSPTSTPTPRPTPTPQPTNACSWPAIPAGIIFEGSANSMASFGLPHWGEIWSTSQINATNRSQCDYLKIGSAGYDPWAVYKTEAQIIFPSSWGYDTTSPYNQGSLYNATDDRPGLFPDGTGGFRDAFYQNISPGALAWPNFASHYLSVRDNAMINNWYYYTDAQGTIFRASGEAIVSFGIEFGIGSAAYETAPFRYVFIDTMDRRPPHSDGSNLATIRLSDLDAISGYHGAFFVNANFEAITTGAPPSVLNARQPDGGSYQLSEVFLKGAIYTAGTLKLGDKVYGSVVSDHILTVGEVYYNSEYAVGLPCGEIDPTPTPIMTPTPTPTPLCGDVNGDGRLDVADIVHEVLGGP